MSLRRTTLSLISESTREWIIIKGDTRSLLSSTLTLLKRTGLGAAYFSWHCGCCFLGKKRITYELTSIISYLCWDCLKKWDLAGLLRFRDHNMNCRAYKQCFLHSPCENVWCESCTAQQRDNQVSYQMSEVTEIGWDTTALISTSPHVG